MDAARLLNGPTVNLVVVSDNAGKMAGIITKTDVVARISQCTGCSCTMAAAEVMTTEVAFCRPDDWLNDVWTTIKDRSLKNVPVVDQNSTPLGVLNARDVLQSLLEGVEYEEQLLRDYVMCVGYR
jgi:CBS domain-containing protein